MDPLAPTPLNAYLTWSLGVDMPGLSVVYAEDPTHALRLLENYCAHAQPKHSLRPTYMPMELRRNASDNERGIHLFPVGVAASGVSAGILVVERGADVRFDD